MPSRLFIPILLITTIACTSQLHDPFALLQAYSQDFSVDQAVKNQIALSHNVTFNTTREKYFFIYFPLMQSCLANIGEDFQPLLNSATPSGIGAAGYGIAAGVKIALKVGLWKTGIFGLLKASTATLFSVSALPVALGVGAMAYMYNKNEQDKIKAKCNAIIQLFETIVRQEQLEFLIKVKATVYQELMQQEQRLDQINQRQKHIKNVLKRNHDRRTYLQLKIQLLQKYFTSLRKIMNY